MCICASTCCFSRLVAVKILTMTQTAEANSTIGQGLIERFYREARAVAALDHKNIIRVFDVERTRTGPFMVMEYIDGIDLDKYVMAHGPIEVNRAAEYIRQAAEGLHHAFEAGLIHRDVKPSNLFLDRAGVVRLLDLGLARFFVDSRKNHAVTEQFDSNAILGTVDYMAPEQAIDSSKVDIRADIYSLGCTLYFLLTGKPVFEAESLPQKMMAHQMREPPPLKASRSDVPEGLQRALGMMIAKKPENRFQAPAEVAEALREFAVPPPAAPDTARMPKNSARSFRLGLCPQPSAQKQIGTGTFPAGPANPGSDVDGSGQETPSNLEQTRRIRPPRKDVEIEVDQEPPRKSPAKLIAAVVAGLAILGGVAAAVMFSGGSKAEPSSQKSPDEKEQQPPKVVPKPPSPGPASLTPAEAAKKVGEKVTVQFVVASMGGKTFLYLNSRLDFVSKDNFAVVLSPRQQVGMWAKPTNEMVVGKTIRATGVVKVYKDATQLELADLKDLVILE
ncbi:MAG: protein kinase [Gemmataceae bacterium]